MSPAKLDPNAAFGQLSDEAWLAVLLASVHAREVQGVALPGFPAEEQQRQFVGSSGEHAVREGFNFYKIVKGYAAALGQPIARGSRVLDFGVGWGRIARSFLRDLAPDDLYGWDVDPDIIAGCRGTFPYGRFAPVPPRPPVPATDDSFNVIIAYSVFSHLNEAVHLEWVAELARVLKRGGVLIATTQGRGFIDFCAQQREKQEHGNEWERALGRCFPDRDAALRDYDAGTFLHVPTGGGDHRPSSFYGETVIPRGWVEKAWTPYLAVREFRDEHWLLPQALIVAQKR